MTTRSGTLSALILLVAAATTASLHADDVGRFDALELRHIGPIGNRAPAVAGVAANPSTYYVGAASGGIFRTNDGGVSWTPVFDDMPAASIGSLAVAPSDPNVVWAGTGETFIRSNVSHGNGIYRSTDRGEHWQHRGLEASGRIGRVVVHPLDPDVVYAAAMGHCYGPQEERGVYRTRDGGESWQRVLFVDRTTGAIDLAMDPNNPRILLAATWQLSISTSGRLSGGPGSGIFRTRDGGDSWERLEGRGLPEPPWGKIGLAMTAADSQRIWALIETSSNRDFHPLEEAAGVLWRSDDGGDSWKLINRDNTLSQRPLYYSRAVAAPDDRDEIIFLAVQQSLSVDGGASIREQNSGWDHHDMWIDPRDGDRRIVGHDGGVSITTNRGRTWFKPQLPIAQIYHANVDDQIPYFVYGNRQDGPSMRGPSNTLTGGAIPIGAWSSVGGCEVGFAVPVPGNPDVVWSGCFDGILERYDQRSGHSRDVSVWPLAIESWAAKDVRYRFQWSFPIALSPFDPETVYVGSQHVHRSHDGGQSWQVISPDLTTGDPALMQRTGGLTLDDAGPTVAPVVFALAPSPLERGLIWAGTNDGKLQLTRDDGESWNDVTAALRGLPPRATISSIEASRHRPGTAYVAIDRHQEGDFATYLYETEDYGETFRSLRANLPQSVLGFAHCLREDPVRSGLLYLGTHNGLWVSFDDGSSWETLQSNLPHAPVHWLAVQEHFGDLVIATYGRGFWILDDLSPLRQLDRSEDGGGAEGITLFDPRPAYRFRERAAAVSQPDDPAAGKNPTYGASLHYRLAEKTEEAVKLVIRDAGGAVVRTLEDLDGEAGLHRVHWDLEHEKTPKVELLMPPAESPHLPLPEGGVRELSDGGRFALLARPGDYAVSLEIGEVKRSTTLQVLQDPHSTAAAADLSTQNELLGKLVADIATAAELINGSEQLRQQLAQLQARVLSKVERDDEVVAAIHRLQSGFEAVEDAFFDLRLTGASQDTLRWQRRLYARLTYLADRIQQTDDRPTDAHQAVYLELGRQLAEQVERYRGLVDEQVPRLNQLLGERQLAGVLPP